jgi:hypothetical protein
MPGTDSPAVRRLNGKRRPGWHAGTKSRIGRRSDRVDHGDVGDVVQELSDLKGGVDLSMASEAPCSAGSCNDPPAMPAWRRIEEYWEMRELNKRLHDEVYGTPPVSSLWDEEGP